MRVRNGWNGGIHPDGVVTVVSVQWFGSEALELTYKTPEGAVANELLYRHDEERLEIVDRGLPWSFLPGQPRRAVAGRAVSARPGR